MPPSSSESDRQKLLLQQEIAKLSGAISRHASTSVRPSSYHPYARGRGTSRGAHPSRGRGAGRGGRPPVQTLVSGEAGWVKNTSKTGNMSLMTAEKSAQLQTRPRSITSDPSRSSHSTSTNEALVQASHPVFTRHRGRAVKQHKQSSRRISDLDKTKLASIPCRYYTKTGRCNRALTCPYRHDAKRLAICPQFLRGVCPNTAESCPLSHNPSPHNTPSCLHFQTSSTCRNGSGCKYPHVRVASDAPICEGFARAGWCDETPGTCPSLHLWECGEWREKGTCSRGAKCGLRHILRAEQAKAILSSGGDFEQNDDFVNLGHGSPALAQSDESDEERDEESDAGTDPSSSTGESDVYSEIDIVV